MKLKPTGHLANSEWERRFTNESDTSLEAISGRRNPTGYQGDALLEVCNGVPAGHVSRRTDRSNYVDSWRNHSW